jgi:predicted RND superfamily exporter protein
MWNNLAKWVLRFRLPLLILITVITAFMGLFASRLQLSYDFSKTIPLDHPKYLEYEAFRKHFGDDGEMLAVGLRTDDFYTLPVFTAYAHLQKSLKQIHGVESILSVPAAVTLVKDTLTTQLKVAPVFPSDIKDQATLDSCRKTFENLPFYRGLLYNPDTRAYLMGISLNKQLINSPARTALINTILDTLRGFETARHLTFAASGLPLIRTQMSNRIQREMRWTLIGSIGLMIVILLVFFRSFSSMFISLLVVGIGVVWCSGTTYLMGYKITLLTGIIPSLVVVIGIPNCIYFLNKYHTEYLKGVGKEQALLGMVSRMGIVTFMCNVSAAIGFAVFAFTQSPILKEFGVVAGINIMALFLVSLCVLPSLLSYLPEPKERETRYLDNALINRLLEKIEGWVFHYRKTILILTTLLVAVAVAGMFRLKSVAFIVDNLPKNDKLYTDMQFFDHNFHGVMPLDIVIDTKKRYGLSGTKALTVFAKMDSLSQTIASFPETSRPLSIVEALKFLHQVFFDGDSAYYTLPNTFDMAMMSDYLSPKASGKGGGSFNQLLNSFIDSTKQRARLSVEMADVGTERLPVLLDTFEKRANQLFDTAKYTVTFTGASVVNQVGNSFIINGLKDSIIWAFILIALCMLYLFRSLRILVCSLIPNVIPLIVTAGIMGWMGIALNPSTVIIFSVALGIAIDVTIRFLVNYKQELPFHAGDVRVTIKQTIRHTGISIVYTSLVLIAGFIVFCFSSFGGIKALGWLTSLTLFIALFTNLILLPVLLMLISPKQKQP